MGKKEFTSSVDQIPDNTLNSIQQELYPKRKGQATCKPLGLLRAFRPRADMVPAENIEQTIQPSDPSKFQYVGNRACSQELERELQPQLRPR